MKLFTVMVCVSLFATHLDAQDNPIAPKDQEPPRFVVIKKVDKDAATITYEDRVADTESLTELSRKVNDPKQQIDAVIKLLGGDLNVNRELPFPLKTGKVYSADGSEVSPEDCLKRMSVGSIAIVSTTGKNIDSAYRKLLQKDAMILVPPVVKNVPKLPPPPKEAKKR
jgi:hypothetical protein